jgi:acetyl esterase/lipase
MSDNKVVNTGLSMGAVLATAISLSANDSILWAIFHGVLGWFYVIYYAIAR